MNKNFCDMLHLFACGAMNTTPKLDHEIDFWEVYSEANSQKVWETTFLSVRRLYDEGKFNIDSEYFEKIKLDVTRAATKNYMRNCYIHNVYELLDKNGIDFCVIKGESIASLYADPLCRISIDVDIYVGEKQISRTLEILEHSGYTIYYDNDVNAHHILAKHNVYGYIEVHKYLFKPFNQELLFSDQKFITEPYRTIKLNDGTNIKVLGFNDALFFLFFHFVKHFITKGVGIRQLMDILIYLSYHKDEIDIELFNKKITLLRYDILMSTIIGIGIEYLNFSKDSLPNYQYDINLCVKFLEDIQTGGMFGKKENNVRNTYYYFLEERLKSNLNNNKESELEKEGIFKKIFMTKSYYIRKYPYVNKCKMLIVVAWLHRVYKYVTGVIKREKPISFLISKSHSAKDDERILLMKQLKMID